MSCHIHSGFAILYLSTNAERQVTERAFIMSETKKIMSEELNKAFASDISSVVFKHCSPFAIVNGEYFIIQFLNAIAPEIKKHISKASADMQKKMSKHISKYQVKR